MEAYVITLKDNELSESCAANLLASSERVKNDFVIEKFNAIYPEEAYQLMHEYGIPWNYPWSGSTLDMATGLLKTAYPTKDPRKRVACFLSHYILWEKCFWNNDHMLIFEHDSIFTARLDLDILRSSRHEIIGINNPIGATRRAMIFNDVVLKAKGDVVDVPKIDEDNIPQGLAGNSAYYITPRGASKLLDLVKNYGAWPNDAIMCRQLMPKYLGVLKSYCTTVQKVQSTTTL